MANRPEAEIEITPALVRGLLADQFPQWCELPLALLDRGWDNTNWRLGDDLIVRAPHREVAAPLIEHEQRWLPEIAHRVDLPIPAPLGNGRACASLGYPWPWSVVPWIEGAEAATSTLTAPGTSAQQLGRFFRQLHTPAPTDAPVNPHRGGPIDAKRPVFARNLGALAELVDAQACWRVFEAAAAAEPTNERVWLHADLHTRNLIVHDGTLAAVIDWGDICSGDRATDLAGAWMLVPDHIEVVARHAGADDAAWHRARGWAVHFAVVYLAHSADDPGMAAIGRRLLAALLDNLE